MLHGRPALRAMRQGGWGARLRSLAMLGGFVAFLGLLTGIFTPILRAFWGQEEFGRTLIRSLVYFLFLALTVLSVLSAVIAMSGRLFLASDAEHFLSRPIPQSQYFRLRYWQGLLSTSWMLIPFWAPMLFALKRVSGASGLFVAWGLLVPLPLSWIACSLGAGLVMLAARRFSARRLRRGFGAAAALMAVGLILLLRVVQPEKLTRPDSAATLEQFLKDWTPAARAWDPVAMAADSVLGALERPAAALGWSLALWAMAAALYVLVLKLFSPGFLKAWLASRELLGPERGKAMGASRLWSLGRGPWRLLWLKELSSFLRNPALRLQLVLVTALSAIFLYNLYRLPLKDDPSLAQMLFLPACGFAQLILISVATRFIFPLESLELQGSWMLRCAPLPAWSFLLSRLAIYAPPLLALDCLLVLSCERAFGPQGPQRYAAYALMLLSPWGLAALNSGLGLAFKSKDATQAEEVTTSPQGVGCMLLCLGYVLAQLGISALPLREYRRQSMELWTGPNYWVYGLSAVIWMGIQAAAIWGPLALARRRMSQGL
jgi:hypothetical protein